MSSAACLGAEDLRRQRPRVDKTTAAFATVALEPRAQAPKHLYSIENAQLTYASTRWSSAAAGRTLLLPQ